MESDAQPRLLNEQLTRSEYLLFQKVIGASAGLRLDDDDWGPLRTALCDRVAAGGFSGFGEYYDLLRSARGAVEMNRLVELLTIHETAFFRNRSHFDIMAKAIVPELIHSADASKSIKIWSAGCSTGQEPYSIAITLLESVPDIEDWHIEVLATDISNRALEIAREAVYPAKSMQDVEPAILDRYFEPVEDRYRVKPEVRRLVRFEHLNLVKEPFPLAALRPCDVIVCENVTIYFKVESTRRVIRNFFDTLRPRGYLFLGYSETLWDISDDFVLTDMENTFVYQKPDGAALSWTRPSGETGAPSTPRPALLRKPGTAWRARRLDRSPSPSEKKASLGEAEALYESGRFEEALLSVESVLSEHPADVGAHILAAKLRADREESGPALRHCRKALEVAPLIEEGHYLMGVLLMRSGEKDAATDSLSKVIYLNPSGHRSALAHFHLGGMYVDVADQPRAAREYRSALKILERFPKDELVGEFSADFLARVCRRRLDEVQ